MRKIAQIANTVVVAAALVASSPAGAESTAGEYPSRPVRFVIPYPPGGNTDVFSRLIGARLSERFGQQFVMDIRPGAVPWLQAGQQAPHLNVLVFARGLLRHLVTRVYFQDDPLLAADPVLRLVREAPRRETLIARQDAGQPGAYRWDIVLQGARETVFFDC